MFWPVDYLMILYVLVPLYGASPPSGVLNDSILLATEPTSLLTTTLK